MVAQVETYKTERDRMVKRQMAARGFEDEAVLAATRSVPRHVFVAEDLQEFAYAVTPLPIEEEQTISQPYIVALMTEALELEPEDTVLEIGIGSDYAAAILSRTRFPTWMWANTQVGDFVRWLQQYNESFSHPEEAVGIYGLDLYSLYRSINLVLDYLEDVDPDTAAVARQRYGCLSPWEGDPATYGVAALTGEYEACEKDVVANLQDLLNKSLQYAMRDGRRFFNAAQNARAVANAERYHRVMYYGSPHSWNLRDEHMFDTLQSLLAFRGPDSRAVVSAHNSHLGNAAATEMGARGQHNLGQLSRAEWGDYAYLVGFGTDHGEVLAANEWGGEAQVQRIRPAHEHSYEALCHQAEPRSFFLPLRSNPQSMLNKRLMNERLERAIGVVYRPQTEIQSHYFRAVLPRQFDEYIWFDETTAVAPVKEAGDADRLPRTFPFGV